MSTDMKIFMGFAIVILSILGIVYLVPELELAAAPPKSSQESLVAKVAREKAPHPASKCARKVAEIPTEKDAPEQPVKLASVPDTEPEPLSRETHTTLLRSKKKLTNADIPASWLKEVQSPPDQRLLDRRKMRDQQLREEIKLRLELAKLRAEEAERERQLQLEVKTAALDNLAWSGWWWPRARGYRECGEKRHRGGDHHRDKKHHYRTSSTHYSRGNHYRRSRSCSSYSSMRRSGGIHFYASIN